MWKNNFFKVGLVACVYFLLSFGNNSSSQTKKVIEFNVDTLTMYRNPAMGWVMYAEMGMEFSPITKDYYNTTTYWNDMESIQAAKYCNILYIRLPWSVLEPEEGKFAWIYNEDYKRFIQKALDHGLKLAFRVFVCSKDAGMQATPQFVFNSGADSIKSNYAFKKGLVFNEPYYDDPVFQEKFGNFIKSFAKEYDNPDKIDFVDGYGLGWWGEGNSITLKGIQSTKQVIEFITGTYAKYFKNILTVYNLNKNDFEFAKPTVYEKYGFLPRRDGLGSFWFGDEERKMVTDYFWPSKPLIGEGCYWIWFDTIGTGYKKDTRFKMNNWSEAMTTAMNDALNYHSNTFDLRVPLMCKYWIENLPDQVQRFITNGGYRLCPKSLEYKIKDRTLDITHCWRNYGVGLLPNSHPNWGHKYKVAFALYDKQKGQIVDMLIDEPADPGNWVKGNDYTYQTKWNSKFLAKNLNLALLFSIIDTKQNKPGISLAIDNAVKIQNWYLAGGLK